MMSGKSRAASRQRNTINRGRRRFIEGIAAAGAVAAFGLPTFSASPGTEPAESASLSGSPRTSSLTRESTTLTNILINLAHIGRLDLLGKLPPYLFVAPEELVKEVRAPAQSQAVQTAISSGLLQVVQLTDPSELTVYAELIQILGIGEAACLTLAQCRGWLIASDERKKFYRETTARLGAGRLLNTAGILDSRNQTRRAYYRSS